MDTLVVSVFYFHNTIFERIREKRQRGVKEKKRGNSNEVSAIIEQVTELLMRQSERELNQRWGWAWGFLTLFSFSPVPKWHWLASCGLGIEKQREREKDCKERWDKEKWWYSIKYWHLLCILQVFTIECPRDHSRWFRTSTLTNGIEFFVCFKWNTREIRWTFGCKWSHRGTGQWRSVASYKADWHKCRWICNE